MKLGQILISRRLLTSSQLALAIAQQMQINMKSKRHFKLGEILMFLKYISLDDLHAALREQTPAGRREARFDPNELSISSVQVIQPEQRRYHGR